MMPLFQHHHPSPRPMAFTLVELLIVVSIVAILALLVTPMFQDSNLTRLRSAATLLLADISYAQVESISHASDPRLLVVDSVNGGYYIAPASAANTPLTNPFDQQPYRVVFGSGRAYALNSVRITGYSLGGDNALRFNAYGDIDQTSNASFTLAIDNNSITITVDPTTGEASAGPIQ